MNQLTFKRDITETPLTYNDNEFTIYSSDYIIAVANSDNRVFVTAIIDPNVTDKADVDFLFPLPPNKTSGYMAHSSIPRVNTLNDKKLPQSFAKSLINQYHELVIKSLIEHVNDADITKH